MAGNVIDDLSGTSTPINSNPYDGLIATCHTSSQEIQERYQLHRFTRNAQQKAKILDDRFTGWILDEHLLKLDGLRKHPGYVDPRDCLVIWARPPGKLRNLVKVIQEKLVAAAPDIWLMPLDNLHMTTLELTHSRTAEEIDKLVNKLLPVCQSIADFPVAHRARLIRPMLSYDTAALALSFVPASGELLSCGRTMTDDEYTYHHLRRDLYAAVTDAGIKVDSRYIVPSAHMTIARFNTPNVFGGHPLDSNRTLQIRERRRWVEEIDSINDWLRAELWPDDHEEIKQGGEWIVGQERGLDFRKGKLWYGGGVSICVGNGF